MAGTADNNGAFDTVVSKMRRGTEPPSDEAHSIVTITPGGFFEAINKMNVPAERMEVPTDVDTVTYANADLTDTMKVFEQYGIRLLTPDEIHTEMPKYPVRIDVQGSVGGRGA